MASMSSDSEPLLRSSAANDEHVQEDDGGRETSQPKGGYTLTLMVTVLMAVLGGSFHVCSIYRFTAGESEERRAGGRGG